VANRDRLPNRRAAEMFDFEHGGRKWTATIGRFPDRRVAEIFLDTPKLSAIGELPDSQDDQFVKAGFAGERSALRALFHTPAACPETVWAKLAAFETDLVREQVAGPAKDSVLLFGLGAIKADLMNLGIRGDVR
jgi:hypothetical protein